MAGLVPAIHVLFATRKKTWMPGTRPGMTANIAAARSAKAALHDWQDTIAGGAAVQMPQTLPDWRLPE
jgi:hypothetical protein